MLFVVYSLLHPESAPMNLFTFLLIHTLPSLYSPFSKRIEELFEEYLVFYEHSHGPKKGGVDAAADHDSSDLASTGISAPHVRRSSVVRLRDLTQERSQLAAVIEEEKRDGSAGDTLRDGWEEFYSEEHQKFYYFNARTETTTWERSDAYHPSVPNAKKSMLHVAAVSAASQADLKDMSSQIGSLWLEALVSVEIPRADATRYRNIFISHNMDFASLVTLTDSRMHALGVTNTAHQQKLLSLRKIAAQLPAEGSHYHQPPAEEDAASSNSGLGKLSAPPSIQRRESDLSHGWSKLVESGTGRTYYWNGETGETRWDLPDGILLEDVPTAADGETKTETKPIKKKKQRRSIIAGESLSGNFVKVTHPKSPAERQLISAALRKNFVFEALSEVDLNDVVDCMARRSVPPGKELIKQGDTGDYFYVIEKGDYDIFVNG